MEQEQEKEELMLLSIMGEDRPGLTASIMAVLAKYNVHVQDIGQADIHSSLSLGILIRVEEPNSGKVMKEVLFKATELNVTVRFVPISLEQYEAWVGRQGKNRYMLTVLGRRLEARQIGAIAQLIAEQGLNIDAIIRLSGRSSLVHPMEKTRACIEFSVRGTPKDKNELHAALLKMSSEMEIDCSFQRDNMYRRMRRLICFDMDSTLIQTEVIDELAKKHGVYDKVAAITAAAMRGEIDFKESFSQRCKLLKGLDVKVMQDIAEHLPFTEGVDRLMYVLKKYGYKIAILSGGFTFFGEHIQKKYGIDYVYANELEVDENGFLTGNFVGEIVDGKRKAELLRLIAQVEKVDLRQTIAIVNERNKNKIIFQMHNKVDADGKILMIWRSTSLVFWRTS